MQVPMPKLCLAMDKEPAESLWVRIKGRVGIGNIIVGVCYSCPTRKMEQMRPSMDR